MLSKFDINPNAFLALLDLPDILFENTVLDSTRTEKTKHQTDVVFILSGLSGYFWANKHK